MSDNNTTFSLAGRRHETLFELNFGLATVYVFIVTILSLMGMCGNTCVIYVIFKEKQMNQHARTFIMSMACADLCVSAIADPMCVVGAFIGMEVIQSVPWLCVATASLCLTVCFCVFLNMLCLTVNRWVYICHNKIYNKLYSLKKCAFMCVACWVIAFAMEFGNFVGWGGHYFDKKSHQCIWDRTASRSFTLFVALGLITSPLIIVAYCNISMIRKVLSVKINAPNNDMSRKNVRTGLSTARTLVAMFIVFVVCWIPYTLVITIDHHDQLSMETHLFVTLLAHAHSSIVCLIYFVCKKQFRDSIRRLCCSSNVVHPSPQTSSLEGRSNTTRTTIQSCFQLQHDNNTKYTISESNLNYLNARC